MLRAEDFKNAKKDAGDMGSGHTVTAFYEIVPPGVKIDLPQVDPLKYQKPGKLATDAGKELLTVKVSYLRPEGKNLRILTQPVHQQKNKFEDASNDFQFAASVAAFGLVLRDSKYKGNADYGEVYRWAVNSQIPQMSPRSEFLRLVTTANRLAKNED